MSDYVMPDADPKQLQPAGTDDNPDDFAQQVRTERLSLLWRFTMIVAGVVFWIVLLFSSLSRNYVVIWATASVLIILGSLLTGLVLRLGHFMAAVWTYAAGILISMGALLYSEPGVTRLAVPYGGVMLVFMVGLLLSPRYLPVLWIATTVVTLGVPMLYDGGFAVNSHQIIAVVMAALSALLVAQISGELYAIAEWALFSYRRERERKIQLHESQHELEKALARSQVLAENLEEARAAAEEAKNFRGQFLANMSHELRTPLNAVIGFSDTMLHYPEMYDDVPLPNEYHRDLAQIYASGTQLLHVINDILDLSKVDAGKLDVAYERVDLMPVVRAALSTATGLVGDKPVKLKYTMPDELPAVWGDVNRVRQVLLNLYSNAAKFTDEGTITLNVDVQPQEVIISVKDTGVGIAPEEQELIFEEFRQGKGGLKRKVTGSGLGLSISRHLIRLMKGKIWVESVEGEGSTFYFTLQRVEQAGNAEVLDTAEASLAI